MWGGDREAAGRDRHTEGGKQELKHVEDLEKASWNSAMSYLGRMRCCEEVPSSPLTLPESLHV